MTSTLTPGEIVADPRMDDINYGIPVSAIGEDGALLALGHHSRRHTLAAFNRYGRQFPGWFNLAEDYSAKAQPWLDALDYRWATFTVPDPAKGEDPDCSWWVHWCTPDTPDARPVTLLPAGGGAA